MIASDAAIDAAMRGWHVFPCQPGGKRPVVKDWEHKAVTDTELIVRYWPDGANTGIACGPSGLVVIDLDVHGEVPPDWQLPGVIDGRDVFALLLEWAGETQIPETYWTCTPSGGWHFYFRAPQSNEIRNSTAKIGPMIDVRAAGGYVLGAGSVVDGSRYEVLADSDPAPLPMWLTRALTWTPPSANTKPVSRAVTGSSLGQRIDGLLRAVANAPEGQRNNVLHWAACRAAEIAAEGYDPEDLAAALIDAACTAGLSGAEARRTVVSGMGGTW